MLQTVISQIFKFCTQKSSNNQKQLAIELAKQLLTFKGIKVPFQEKDYTKMKEHNKISINALG